MMSALPPASARFSQLWIAFLNYLLDGVFEKKISLISTFPLFSRFNHDFIIYIDFPNIVASNTATGDFTITN